MTGPSYLIRGPPLKQKNVPNLAAAEKMMAYYIENKFDVVKVHSDLPRDIYELVLNKANKSGIMVTGHTQHKMPLADTLRMDSVEHVEELLYVSMHESHVEDVDAELFFKDHAKKLVDFEYRCLDPKKFKTPYGMAQSVDELSIDHSYNEQIYSQILNDNYLNKISFNSLESFVTVTKKPNVTNKI